MSTTSGPPSTTFSGRSFRRGLFLVTFALVLGLGYLLRGVLVPLFFAFLLAYALDPFVDWLEARNVSRGTGMLPKKTVARKAPDTKTPAAKQ